MTPASPQARLRSIVIATIGVAGLLLTMVGAAPSSAAVPASASAPASLVQSTPDLLASARDAAATLAPLHSLLVSRRGEVILEHYAPGWTRTRLANVKSVSKSVIATLVGIAIDRGLIPSVREPIATWFPELRRDADPRKRAITVEDLLTMRSGLESTSGEGYGPWVRSGNWVRYVLGRPLVSAPGTSMEYSTGTSHVLSAMLTKVSKTSTRAFAQQALATPLGFTLARWPRDPQGIDMGGNEMLMTPRQMLALGELYRLKGEVQSRRILSAAWVETSCVPRTQSRWDPDRLYGYGWWIQPIGGKLACFAWGFGGQYIFVVRDLDLTIVVTSSANVSDERFEYRRRLLTLIEEHILPRL
jgi:CubicO group peptidase (beta-lactamase class C family)